MGKRRDQERPSSRHRYEVLWQEIGHDEHSDREPCHLIRDAVKQTDTNDDDFNLAEFQQLTDRLERFTVAGPTEGQTQALLTTLTPLIARDEGSIASFSGTSDHHSHKNGGFSAEKWSIVSNMMDRSIWSRFLMLLLQQVPLFSWIFWVATLLIIALGAVALSLFAEENLNPFFMLVPLVSGSGIFYALRAYRTPMGELETTFPVSPAEIMIGRLGVVLVYNIGFALLASIALFASGVTDMLILFIISWLVPLCCYTMITLVCMIRIGSLAGAVISIAVWGTQLFMRELLGPFYLHSDIGSTYWETSRLIGTVVTLLLGIYVVRILIKERDVMSDGDLV